MVETSALGGVTWTSTVTFSEEIAKAYPTPQVQNASTVGKCCTQISAPEGTGVGIAALLEKTCRGALHTLQQHRQLQFCNLPVCS